MGGWIVRWIDRWVDGSKASIFPKPFFLKASWLFNYQLSESTEKEGILVGFCYTTALVTQEYPEVWVSITVVLGMFLLGLLIEVSVVLWVVKNDEIALVFNFNSIGDWVIYGTRDPGFLVKIL